MSDLKINAASKLKSILKKNQDNKTQLNVCDSCSEDSDKTYNICKKCYDNINKIKKVLECNKCNNSKSIKDIVLTCTNCYDNLESGYYTELINVLVALNNEIARLIEENKSLKESDKKDT